jgi:hypothetical protein
MERFKAIVLNVKVNMAKTPIKLVGVTSYVMKHTSNCLVSTY